MTMMNVAFHAETKTKASTLHQDECAVLKFSTGYDNSVTIFGPVSAKAKFNRIVELFNQAMEGNSDA